MKEDIVKKIVFRLVEKNASAKNNVDTKHTKQNVQPTELESL